MQATPSFPRSRFRALTAWTALGALLISARASAQAEAEKPKPNILLLVDTSGSMEFKTDGTLPTCNADDSSATNDKSRWIDLTEVLTGSFDDYSCWAQDRSSEGFRDEFSLGTTDPYDFGYTNPYHRVISNSCVQGPGAPSPSTAPFSWLTHSVNTFGFTGSSVTRPISSELPTFAGCSGYQQADDGLLDIFKNQVRFGLMTFDTRINSGTGLNGTSANIATGMAGTWSYYLDTPVTGHPANCSFDLPQEIGARNAAAPAWEGRMVAFGNPDGSDTATRNEWVQDVLLSTRPYGATPVAGLLHDAKEFLWFDTNEDPLNPGEQFGPTNDPSWRATDCRKSIVVLLTDGEPNLDLRPSCEEDPSPGTPGRCPYPRPEEIVAQLRDPDQAPSASLAVDTYVIGFALGEVTPDGLSSAIPCSELTDSQCTADANQDPDDPESKKIQACCTLNKIAAAGSEDETGQPRKAFFANNRTELRQIFTDILDDVVQVATRTMPVFSSPGGDTSTSGFKFFSAFDPQPDPSGPQLWEGVLQRTRSVCTDLVPVDVQVEEQGDDFAVNLASSMGSNRHFYTFIGTGASADNRNSLRPAVEGNPDGLGGSTGTAIGATNPSDFIAPVLPAAMGIDSDTCSSTDDLNLCRNLILKHAIGMTNEDNVSRCPTAEDCHLLGGIYHSTPTIVAGRPSEQLRDDSYREFVNEMALIARPSALYTSTVDGLVHAFKLAPFPGSANAADNRVDSSTKSNELWSFIPPAVLPNLHAQYPSTPAILLDGLPIIKDVVAYKEGDDIIMERTAADARSGSGLWRTVMVQAFGESQIDGGYFAIDITDPRQGDGKPEFLWQLTRSSAGTPLFGSGGTPLITTVFVGDAVTPGREVPVAILPGGNAAPTTGTSATVGPVMVTDPVDFAIDQPTRLYTGQERARSLTVVRLDTGEVLRTFRPTDGPFSSTVVSTTDIPSPIVGQPVAFPATTGSIAEQVFVGDADGRLWRLDVTSKDPGEWKMEVFFDAYWNEPDPSVRQPIELPPVLSVNDSGDVTVAFATGDQEATVGNADMVNHVVSLTEKLNGPLNEFYSKVNWVHTLTNGTRATGPMVLFSRGLYYATSRPPDTTSAQCDVGQSQVFGSHYELDEARALDPAAIASLDKPAPAPGADSIEFSELKSGLIFGVSLDAEPSCSSEAEAIPVDEGFLYSPIDAPAETKPGGYFLSFEVSGSGEDPRGVEEVRQELENDPRPVTFSSFALIYD